MSKREVILGYRKQISECKRKLRVTDYKAIKFAEGEISSTEYEPILSMRRELRAAINEYEQKIAELKCCGGE